MGANLPYVWLDYAPGRIAHVPIGGNDTLTGYMSGCPIVRGTYGGAMSVFHVGTIVGNPGVNQIVKRRFAQNLPVDATGFNPAGAWTPGEVAAIQGSLGGATVATPNIFALVTTAGAFYAIVMFNVCHGGVGGQWTNPAGRRYWCVGGKKLVPALSRVKLMAWLLS